MYRWEQDDPGYNKLPDDVSLTEEEQEDYIPQHPDLIQYVSLFVNSEDFSDDDWEDYEFEHTGAEQAGPSARVKELNKKITELSKEIHPKMKQLVGFMKEKLALMGAGLPPEEKKKLEEEIDLEAYFSDSDSDEEDKPDKETVKKDAKANGEGANPPGVNTDNKGDKTVVDPNAKGANATVVSAAKDDKTKDANATTGGETANTTAKGANATVVSAAKDGKTKDANATTGGATVNATTVPTANATGGGGGDDKLKTEEKAAEKKKAEELEKQKLAAEKNKAEELEKQKLAEQEKKKAEELAEQKKKKEQDAKKVTATTAGGAKGGGKEQEQQDMLLKKKLNFLIS